MPFLQASNPDEALRNLTAIAWLPAAMEPDRPFMSGLPVHDWTGLQYQVLLFLGITSPVQNRCGSTRYRAPGDESNIRLAL